MIPADLGHIQYPEDTTGFWRKAKLLLQCRFLEESKDFRKKTQKN